MSVFPSTETWTVGKPAVESAGGVVTSQHYVASRIGAEVLANGREAVWELLKPDTRIAKAKKSAPSKKRKTRAKATAK